jgi:hypothetical protein
MPAKKATKIASARQSTSAFECPNPKGKPYSLNQLVGKMLDDQEFAVFIRNLLCRAHKRDKNAAECLDSYYQPTDAELAALCIPPAQRARILKSKCTETNNKYLLIDVPAYVAAKKRAKAAHD